MITPRADRRRSLVPLALALTMSAGLPAQAQLKGVTGSGLYDFLIQTNCYSLSEQQNTRTPHWQGNEVRARLPEWKAAGNSYMEQHIPVPPNGNKVSFDFVARFPSDAKAERVGPMALNASFVVPVELKPETYGGCPGLITNPRSAEVSYTMSKRLDADLQAKPSIPRPSSIQQAPLPRPGSSDDGVPAPRDPLPSKPDSEPEDYPKPKPGIRQ